MQSCNLIRCDDEAMTDLFQGSRPEVALGLRCGFLGRRERTESAQFRTSAVTTILECRGTHSLQHNHFRDSSVAPAAAVGTAVPRSS